MLIATQLLHNISQKGSILISLNTNPPADMLRRRLIQQITDFIGGTKRLYPDIKPLMCFKPKKGGKAT